MGIMPLSGPNYMSQPRDPHTWIVEGILPVGGAINIFGAAKVGKSFTALTLASAISDPAVEEWMGFPVRKHGRVFYLQIDTPRYIWMDRIGKMEKAGWDFLNVYFVDALMLERFPMNILVGEDKKDLHLAIKHTKPEVVIIDVMREIHSGDENDSTVMRNVVANLIEAVKPSALVLLSHPRKGHAKEKGDDMINANRGSNYIAGRMDTIIRQSDKRMAITGRATESIEFPIKYVNGVPQRVGDENEREKVIRDVLLEMKGQMMQKQAEVVAERLGITVGAARQAITRWREKNEAGEGDINYD